VIAAEATVLALVHHDSGLRECFGGWSWGRSGEDSSGHHRDAEEDGGKLHIGLDRIETVRLDG